MASGDFYLGVLQGVLSVHDCHSMPLTPTILCSFPRDHPFAQLSGTDNMVVFTTERYRERPLVIRGPGAGAEVTAAGVFGDILQVIRCHGPPVPAVERL